MKHNFRPPQVSALYQQGAALYVALIMLILLSMIGIVGMQVATMQERMSANYLASNMAFQRAEMLVRNGELDVINGVAIQDEDEGCTFDPQDWAESISATDASGLRVRNLRRCMGCSLVGGSDPSESLCDWYRITAFSRDRDTAAASSSLAAIDTIFVKP